MKSTEIYNNRDTAFNGFGGSYSGSMGKPWYFTTNPNRKRKQNKLRLSHNAKLKRRKSA